ncbi:MAG TPA: GAF domain-containing protein, partial [Anaerolineales bacterium]|nr:GAF domain-containing protein [Anaerolineales bacterium]
FAAALWADGAIHKPWNEPRPNGLTATVAHTGELILVPDMSNHPLFQDTPRDWNGAIIGVPLKFGNCVVGVMNIAFIQPRQFKDREVRMIRLLGDQAAIAIENARLYQQAATERRHLSLLYQISRDVISSLDPDEVLERAIALTCQVLGGIVGQAFVYLPEEGRLSLRAIYGRPAMNPAYLNLTYPMKPGVGLTGWVAKLRQPIFLEEVRDDPRWIHIPGVDDDVHSAITAPILAGDELLGIFSVSHHRPGAFSEDHLELMMAICQEVGLALSNARQYQEVQHRLAEMTLLQNLSQILNQRLDPHQMLGEIARQLAAQAGYELVWIYQVEKGQPTLAAQSSQYASSTSLSTPDELLQKVIASGQAAIQVIPNTLDQQLLPTSWACVPVFRQKSVTGAICVASQQTRQLTAHDIDFLEVLGGQMSVALENTRLYEQILSHADELEVTVLQRTNELTELYELSQEIGFSLSYENLLQLLLRRLQNAFRNGVVAGYLSTSETVPVTITVTRPISPAAVIQVRKIVEEALAESEREYLATHEPGVQLLASAEFEDLESLETVQLTNFITAPIFTGKRLMGMLILASDQAVPLDTEQYRLLNTFANQARTAVQRLEAILTAQQEHLERLVKNIPIGTVLLDENMKILVTNPLGQEILAVLSDQPASPNLSRLGNLPASELTLRQDDPLPVVIELDGVPPRVFEAQIRPVQAEIHQWVLTLREVTRERESQARIQSQERLATVGQLAAGIAHDFNNIMAAILVYTNLLGTDPKIADGSREKLDIIERQIQRAASLIRQILDFSRRSVMEQTDIDLLPFIKELDQILERVLPENIRLVLNYLPGSYLVNVDPTRMQQVFMNLALNARDAMPQGGILQFELGRVSFDKRNPPPIADMPD